MTSGDYRTIPAGRREPSVCYDAIAGRRNEACERAVLHCEGVYTHPRPARTASTTKGGSGQVDI